ncbi:serine O-acetyltransferase [Williamsia herbipolensis]|uniref:serine O-acetyltransferase n=1 Tax=Williamsia herbipolensis TaxID=1603258 RepID=UPI002E2D9880|nr:DapH/DapD/GlmU-related protein [Williamsia herbipolensis]
MLLSLRVCQWLMGDRASPRPISWAPIACHRVLTEFVLGMEIRPKVTIGPGLTIYHGFGIVINNEAVIGSGVTLRNAVTIGHQRPGGPSPRIGDGVSIGAGAIILGGISIGEKATIAAGAVVVHDVAPGATVVGNPAREIVRREHDGHG